MLEYTARASFQYGRANDLISNIKKPEDRKSNPNEYKWKTRAIHELAAELQQALPLSATQGATWVPVPPSKAKSDPLYDDRLTRILRAYGGSDIDIRDMVIQAASAQSSRLMGGGRPNAMELSSKYVIDEGALLPSPSYIVIFDDVLTSGAHYRALHDLLRNRLPSVAIFGVFLARTVQM